MTTDMEWIRRMTGDRAAYISGARKFLDLLEAHEEIPLPYYGTCRAAVAINFLSATGRNREALAAAARAFPGPLEKATTGDTYFDLRGKIDEFYFELSAFRNEVCERVVTGVETITRTVRDPNVVVPTVEVTEEVETVEWRCSSILA